MNKKKTLKKHEFSLTEFKPEEFFKDKKKIAEALLQCLIENDTESYMEILDAYLRVNRTQVAISADLSRSTVSNAFSKKGNPTLKTIAQIVHESIRR